jgi:myosin heavy subunit
LGENVSLIEDTVEGQSVILQHAGNSNDTNLILELSEENEQLKDKVEDLNRELSKQDDRMKHLKHEIHEKSKQQSHIIDFINRESAKIGINSEISHQSSTMIIEFIRDMISHVDSLSKELTRKEEKLQNFEELNRDIKIAYSAVVYELENTKKAESRNNLDILTYLKQIEELRSENIEYAERERNANSKIAELE